MSQKLRLGGQRALVTAAGNGIGRAIALAFADEGAEVLATDINQGALENLVHENITTAVLDAGDPDAIAASLAAHSSFDILVNGVGYVHHGTLLECSWEDWRRSFDLNIDTMYHMTRGVLPGMIDKGAGAIVNIASAASSVKGFPYRAAYGTTKAAVIGLTKAVAVDHMTQGIRCNAICPGTIQSPSLQLRMEELGKTLGSYEAAHEAFVARQPMGRLGTAEEIAAMATYLAGPESAYTTGQAFIIDGGTLA